jgi:hypothetical protein
MLAVDVMTYADAVGAVAHNDTLPRAAAAISNLATIVHEVPQLDLHSGHAKLEFGAAVQSARMAHSVLVNANDVPTAEHHGQQKAVSIDIYKPTGSAVGSTYTAFYAAIGHSADDPATPGSVAELSFYTKVTFTPEQQNHSTREHGDIGVIDKNFQDGPQVHHCECSPGWCVSPLQLAHPPCRAV